LPCNEKSLFPLSGAVPGQVWHNANQTLSDRVVRILSLLQGIDIDVDTHRTHTIRLPMIVALKGLINKMLYRPCAVCRVDFYQGLPAKVFLNPHDGRRSGAQYQI